MPNDVLYSMNVLLFDSTGLISKYRIFIVVMRRATSLSGLRARRVAIKYILNGKGYGKTFRFPPVRVTPCTRFGMRVISNAVRRTR